MRYRFTLPFTCLALLLLVASPAGAAPDSGPAEIQLQRSLDAPIDLALDKTELNRAFEVIAAAAKISLQVDAACYEALPYGQTTKVSAAFRGSTARSAIDEILMPLGLEQAPSGGNLVIRPSPPLALIGRKAEWEELKLLKELRITQLPKLESAWTADLRTLLGRPDMIVRMEPLDTAVNDKALAQVRAALPCGISQALDIYANATAQVWTVANQNILILPPKKWIARQLERPIVIHFTNAPLAEVVADLARLSRIRMAPEPGLFQAVPRVSLDSQDGTVQMTLDALAGATGITPEVRDDGILLHLPGKPGTPAPRGSGDAIVGHITVPLAKSAEATGNAATGAASGASIDLFIRESDLPPELNDLRKKRLAEAIAVLQQSLTKPESLTKPATTTK